MTWADGLIPIMQLDFGRALIDAAHKANATGMEQDGGTLWGCRVVVLPPKAPPPLRCAERFLVRFNHDGSLA